MDNNLVKKTTILVIAAGPIVVGQSCEFDYSGTQGCRVLQKMGYRVVLVNSNPATIMTDPQTADAIYIEPITAEFIEKVIQKEKPEKLLPTVGGQTALNVAMQLVENGVLEKYNVELIGAKKEVIENAEKRSKFNAIAQSIGAEVPKNITINHVNQIEKAFKTIGLPAIIRPSFTLGGLGSGIAKDKAEFFSMATEGLKFSPISEVQIDESIIGWQEFELEVVRDKNDNCIVVCPIENIDPMGVHTGDSITVAPTFTLRNAEYQKMRNFAFDILRKIGVDTGGANVQFAFNPKNGAIRVIEMNPRVSRSSALASKATGYPIAKVAAQLAAGRALTQIKNDAVNFIPAAFEPAIDYVVVKIPRFNFEKFAQTKKQLSSSMKSIGEAMAIGRCFQEALQKALCSLEQDFDGLSDVFCKDIKKSEIETQLKSFLPNKVLIIADALRKNFSVEKIEELTNYNKWYIRHIQNLVKLEEEIKESNFSKLEFLEYKKQGFSDSRIANLSGKTEEQIRLLRKSLNVLPVFKRIDTCAAEFKADIAYLYSTYESETFGCDVLCEAKPSDQKKVIVLGSGPNRIGQGIEFDYACVHAILAIKELEYQAIMINCNPETVSTDYDVSDKLYFSPLTLEYVLDVIDAESRCGQFLGVVLQFGGQTPLKLAKKLKQHGVKILGTNFDAIDICEDRNKFNDLACRLGLRQPKNCIAFNRQQALDALEKIDFPMIVRPSYVLGGQSMQVVYDLDQFQRYIEKHSSVFEHGALLFDKFLSDAIEVDLDAICDGNDVYIAGVMEHIEEAGVHSGDSAFVLPYQKIPNHLVDQMKDQTKKIALELNVIGLINIQFAVKNDDIYILEVNPRSSRTVPFVAKALGMPIAKIATKILLGKKIKDFDLKDYKSYLEHVFVKQPVFSFEKFPGSDVLLGPEMKSTGEVMGVGSDFESAFAKSYIASKQKLPLSGNVFFSVKNSDKQISIQVASILLELGFCVFATKGTAKFLKSNGINAVTVNKVKEGKPHIVDMILSGKIDLVINTSSHIVKSVQDSMSIRSTCTINKIPCCTNIHSALAICKAIKKLKQTNLPVYRI